MTDHPLSSLPPVRATEPEYSIEEVAAMRIEFEAFVKARNVAPEVERLLLWWLPASPVSAARPSEPSRAVAELVIEIGDTRLAERLLMAINALRDADISAERARLKTLVDQLAQHRRTFDGTTEYIEWSMVEGLLLASSEDRETLVSASEGQNTKI